ncbi:MAG TPA: hypothetical protein VGP30_00050, partial [Candidatus Limnocylindrales bacterium]|nr:hypothetical protein [Candidatus Limnocylindrales bacterium]
AAGDPGGGGGNGVGGKPPDRGFFEGLPELQLFDREAGLWVEFEDPENGVTYLIADPSRFVDEAGAFRARFVNRHGDGEYAYFTLLVRMEGTVG